MLEQNERTTKIRKLNDEFRRTGTGGKMFISSGIAALPFMEQVAVLNRVRLTEDFNEANDPYCEHDYGSFDHNGQRIIFKIDYYNKDETYFSEDHSNPELTTRVMTIMLAHEY